MDSEVSLPCSQDPDTGPYSEPDECNHQLPILFLCPNCVVIFSYLVSFSLSLVIIFLSSCFIFLHSFHQAHLQFIHPLWDSSTDGPDGNIRHLGGDCWQDD